MVFYRFVAGCSYATAVTWLKDLRIFAFNTWFFMSSKPFFASAGSR
jgi:hypothetical protein